MTPAPSVNWTQLISKAVDANYPATDALMGRVPEDSLDWKPNTGTNWMTTGQVLMHLTNACGFCFQGFVTGDWGLPEGMTFDDMPKEEMLQPAEKLPTVGSVAEARRLLTADRELAVRMIDEAGEERLQTEMSKAPWGGPDCSENCLGEHLLGMVNHLAAHRAQLFYYLKLQGQDVNTMDLWGM